MWPLAKSNCSHPLLKVVVFDIRMSLCTLAVAGWKAASEWAVSLLSCGSGPLAGVSSHLHHPRIPMRPFWQHVESFGVRTN